METSAIIPFPPNVVLYCPLTFYFTKGAVILPESAVPPDLRDCFHVFELELKSEHTSITLAIMKPTATL